MLDQVESSPPGTWHILVCDGSLDKVHRINIEARFKLGSNLLEYGCEGRRVFRVTVHASAADVDLPESCQVVHCWIIMLSERCYWP